MATQIRWVNAECPECGEEHDLSVHVKDNADSYVYCNEKQREV